MLESNQEEAEVGGHLGVGHFLVEDLVQVPLSLPPILPHFPVDPAQRLRAGCEAQKEAFLRL